MKKLFSVMMALLFILSMSISSFAAKGEYFDTIPVSGYTESLTEVSGSEQEVFGQSKAGNNSDVNIYEIRKQLSGNFWGCTTQEAYDKLINYSSELKELMEKEWEDVGAKIVSSNFSMNIVKDSQYKYEFINLQLVADLCVGERDYKDTYYGFAIILAGNYEISISVINTDGISNGKRVFQSILSNLVIHSETGKMYSEVDAYYSELDGAVDDYYGELNDTVEDYYDEMGNTVDKTYDEMEDIVDKTYDEAEEIMNENLGFFEKILAKGFTFVILTILAILLIPIIIITIIVVLIVKASKKKKSQNQVQQPQQYYQNGFNPNAQPQQPYNYPQQPYVQPQQPTSQIPPTSETQNNINK